jgi:hypothetical protein
MADFPRSLLEIQRRFPDERGCASYLAKARWPGGFRCPGCGHDKGWELATKAFTWECAGCGKQTSVTAGTVMHCSKLPLTVWFWAAYLMATHPNGIAALQLQKQLGLGSYESAWLLCAELRRAMVAPGRALLAGLVEIDDTAIPHRTKADPPVGGHGRSADGKMLVAGAIAKTDGWPAYQGAPGVSQQPHVVGPMAAHIVLPWTHRVFANLKRWVLGVYHGLREKHLQSYLDEFAFRFNCRRRTRYAAFRSLLAIGVAGKTTTYKMLIVRHKPFYQK